MCKKLMLLINIVLVLGLVGSASALVYNWDGEACPGDRSWGTAANWHPDGVPGGTDLALIDCPPDCGPLINSSRDIGEIGGPRLSGDCNQAMDITSGTVNIGWMWGFSEGGSGTGTLNMVGDAVIECGGIEGGYAGHSIINVGGTTQSHGWEWRLCNEPSATVELNITDDVDLSMGPEKNAWRFADKGTMVTNISGNPNIYIDGKWRNADETGHIEVNMSGGTLYVGRYLSCYDDGSATINFSGGSINVNGLSFAGRAGKSYELNVSGTADVTARTEIRLGYSFGPGSPTVGSATFNVTGGTVNTPLISTYGTHGTININIGGSGGVVSCGAFNANEGPYAMDICGSGTLILDGDATAQIQADIDAGYITACGSDGVVIFDYDLRNPGKTTVTAALVGAIDIKPGSCPNPLNVESNGVLTVAVLGTEALDASSIDPASIRLEGVAALRSSLEDVATPVHRDECECTEEGPDGFADLILKFKVREIAEAVGPVTAGQTVALNLTGALIDGTGIAGSDCMVIVGKKPRALEAKPADATKDGVIDMLDLGMVAEYWLEACMVD